MTQSSNNIKSDLDLQKEKFSTVALGLTNLYKIGAQQIEQNYIEGQLDLFK